VIRILLADDHAVVRQGLRVFLSHDTEIKVVGEAENGERALHMARDLQPDVVLMDMVMPVMDGVEATRAIRAEMPDVEVLAVTSVLDDTTIISAVQAGAIGYLLKDATADDLCRAIRAAAAGQVQLAPQVALRLLQELQAPARSAPLTARETEVLRLIAEGLTNREIARELLITEKTAKSHVSNLLHKLGLQSRTQAAVYAARIGIVTIGTRGGS
jgi:two-component system, NarL family, response regulator LiaR